MTKGRRRREDKGGKRYLEVPGSRREGNSSCAIIGKSVRGEYLSCKASEVPSLRFAEFTITLAEQLNIWWTTVRTCQKYNVVAQIASPQVRSQHTLGNPARMQKKDGS